MLDILQQEKTSVKGFGLDDLESIHAPWKFNNEFTAENLPSQKKISVF